MIDKNGLYMIFIFIYTSSLLDGMKYDNLFPSRYMLYINAYSNNLKIEDGFFFFSMLINFS